MNATTASAAAPEPNGSRTRILSIVAVAFVVLSIAWWLYWFFVQSVRETTDDAYVSGDKVLISSQVPGTVIAISAEDTQLVKAGQVLVQLDPTDAASALNRAGSALAQAVRQVRQQSSTANQYDSLIASRRLELTRAEADLARREPLLAEQAIAPEEVRHARENVALAKAALTQAVQQAQAAKALVEGTDVAGNPSVQQAKASYIDAWIAARRNAILAPVTGYVAERNVQLGQRIAPGEALLTVVPLHSLWADANFKEVQLRHLRIGQPASFESDLYGSSVKFRGRVVGVAAGTGAAFSLLPAQNASGNWIKVVQRVPVRIEIEPRDLARYPLRIGLSLTVEVDTHDRSGPVLAASPTSHAAADTNVYTRDMDKGAADADAIIAKNLH